MKIEDYINIVIRESQLEAADQSFMRVKGRVRNTLG